MSTLAIPLERDVFLRTLLRHLAGTLQGVVVYLKPTPEADAAEGREDFQA